MAPAVGSMTEARQAKACGVMATVIGELPNATWTVELEDRRQVLAHATGAPAANFVRVRVGDRVRVELSDQDPARGRIVRKV